MAEYIHGDLMSQEGRTAEFGEDTGIPCPACGHGEKPNTLFVRTIIENSATIECKSCGHVEHRPKAAVVQTFDRNGRPIPLPKR